MAPHAVSILPAARSAARAELQKRPPQLSAVKPERLSQPPTSLNSRKVIEWFNDEFCVVLEAGHTHVLRAERDAVLDRRIYRRIRIPDFLAYFNRPFGKITTQGELWLNSPARRQYDGVGYWPKREAPAGKLNLWQGFSVEAERGDCSLSLDHLLNVVCRGDEKHYAWVVGWFAHCVQRPDEPPQSAIVLRGGQGVGKGAAVWPLLRMLGQHGIHLSDVRHLTGQFTGHLEDCSLVFLDEAIASDDEKAKARLKALITEPTITIERKYHDASVVKNRLHIILATNNQWAVNLDKDDRRFCVLDVSDEHAKDKRYFDALYYELEHGGDEALLYHLLHEVDLSSADLRDPPDTDAKHDQIRQSMNVQEQWWWDVLRHGMLVGRQWETELRCEAVTETYAQAIRELSELTGKRANASPTACGMFLSSVLPSGFPRRVRASKGTRPWVYQFPPLKTCRDEFRRKSGRDFDWERL
jgi:hypothetical protein